MRLSMQTLARAQPAGDETLLAAWCRAAESSCGVHFVRRRQPAQLLSYGELFRSSREIAAGLTALPGWRAGRTAAIFLQTGPEFYRAFFGVMLAGGIPVPLYPPLRLGRLAEYHARTRQMLDAVSAQVVVTDKTIRRLLADALTGPQLAKHCFVGEELVRRGRLAEPVISGSVPEIAPLAGADQVAFLQFSSGTTVAPKAIAVTHRQVLANVSAIAQRILRAYPEDQRRTHRPVSWLPLYHDMGLVGVMLTAVCHPSDVVLIRPQDFIADPAIWLRAISDYRGTISAAPNFGYAYATERIPEEALRSLDLRSWCVALNGAEPVSAAVMEQFARRFSQAGFPRAALTPVYGLAEATLAVTFSALDAPFRRADAALPRGWRHAATGLSGTPQGGRQEQFVSVGWPVGDTELRVVDDADQPVKSGEVGRILVRGASVTQGYWGSVRAAGGKLGGGWLDTGDLGFLDDEGELYLVGRQKELIIVRGRNYLPQDVELAAQQVAGVRTGCVAAVGLLRDDTEQLWVFAEHRHNAANEAARLAEQVAAQVVAAIGLRPAKVVVVEPGTLPRTSSGKIRRNETLSQYLAGRLLPPKSVLPWQLAGAMVRSESRRLRMKYGH